MIFIGHFSHASQQNETSEADRRHGEFSLITSADSEVFALEQFRERISAFRSMSNLFDGECRIYLNRMLKLEHIPQNTPILFAYKSVAGDPLMPYIECASPSEMGDSCEIVEWHDNQAPEIEGLESLLFLEFPADSP